MLAKMEAALQQPILEEREKSRTPSPKETRRVKRTNSEEDESEDERRKSAKKSRKKKDTSSSDSEDRKKAKKKKKKRSRSSSSSSSDETATSKSKLTLDENVLKMVASIKGKSGKKSDEMLVDLLSKMSEAYSESKNENKELKDKIEALEVENSSMKDEITKLKEETAKYKNVKYVLNSEDDTKREKANKKMLEPKIEPVLPPLPHVEDQHRSVRAKMLETEMAKPRNVPEPPPPRKAPPPMEPSRRKRSYSPSSGSSSSRSRSRSKSRSKRDDYSRSRRNYSRSRSRSPSKSKRARSRSRTPPRRSSRSKSRSRSRSRSRSNSMDRGDRRSYRRSSSRNDRSSGSRTRSTDINLDEWRPKHADREERFKSDSTLSSIKEKLKAKQEMEMAKKREEDEANRRKKESWNSFTPVATNAFQEGSSRSKTTDHMSENLFRPQVAIQWGQKNVKGKTPEPQTSVKKAVPFVGKMPGKKKDTTTPDREAPTFTKTKSSRFGGTAAGVPPPTVMTDLAPPPKPNVMPPALAMPIIRKAAPKNPTPKNVDIQDMLAAAKAHMMARGEAPQQRAALETDIPLPPLPAAQDRDPEAMKDTRPPKLPTPPPAKVSLTFLHMELLFSYFVSFITVSRCLIYVPSSCRNPRN